MESVLMVDGGFELLKNNHLGDDIWVVGSGPSAGFIDPEFFVNKTSIGVNFTWQRFPVDYVVQKESYAIQAALEGGQRVVASRYHCGDRWANENRKDIRWKQISGVDWELFIFDHLQNECASINLSPVGNERDLGLVVSYSTITSGIHLAAWMGAKNIILVGHDCGMIDGQLKMSDYFLPDFQVERPEFYRQFIGSIEPQTLALKERLADVYGCRVYSLNPWINLGMEGHVYERV